MTDDRTQDRTEDAPTLTFRAKAGAPRNPGPIGPYRLLDRIGMGGMGEVWLAEQTEPIKRRVALKLIRSGLDLKAVVARFESERQALALMNHPAIARVFDAGTTDDGRPYFAMEYVAGEPITTYCDRVRASNRDRLELMIDVCHGVQHAHQKAIIHRDLKPSNILVQQGDERPQPKIIDFGIAKAVGQKLTEQTMYTQVGQFIGTIHYVSPEQADPGQLGVDTRADVYALGVVLYQLLTGALPFDAEEMQRIGHDEARRRIREVDPPRPSTRVSSMGDESTEWALNRRTEVGTLARELRGDLDWIVLKALEKDRTRRYGSPDELADDLRRFLAHEPVSARPPSTIYRTKKFVRRHRVVVAFAAILFAAALALVGTTLVQNRRIAQERDRANREALAANAALDFMTNLFSISDPSEARGNSITAREVLDRGAAEIETSFEDAPEVRARMMGTIGRVYESLGLYQPAERALEAALRLQRDQENEDPATLADAISDLGWLKRERGEFAGAEEAFREALAIRLEHQGGDHLSVASSINRVGIVRSDLGDFEGALELHREALEIADRQEDGGALERLTYLQNIANAYADLGRPAEAVPTYREILASRTAQYGGDHMNVAFAHDNLALVLHDLGQEEEAEVHFRQALEMLLRVFGPEHPEVAQTQGNVASFLLDVGKLDEAESMARRAAELTRGILGEGHFMTADHLSTLAGALLEKGDLDRAAEVAEEILPIYRRSLPEDHVKVGVGESILGAVRSAQGRYSEAESLLTAAYRRQLQSPHSDRALQEARDELLELFERMGEAKRGEALLQEMERNAK